MRFAANVSMLFTELPFLDRFSAARDTGFDGVEILFPYDLAAKDILRAMTSAGMPLVLINTPPPNWTGGDRGFAAVPGGEARFRSDFDRALRYGEVLGADIIHIMSGVASGPEARATMVDNLNWAVSHAPQQRLTIEPINAIDMPGYFLSDFDLADGLLDEVAPPNLALQFDAYHAHMMAGDVLDMWDKFGHRAGHVQIAGAPGRAEPGTGDVDYPAFFDRLAQDNYRGWISAEYHPAGATFDGLDWLPR